MEEKPVQINVVNIKLSHEEVQNFCNMTAEEANEHLRIWYAIDTTRIISALIIEEATFSPILCIKISRL